MLEHREFKKGWLSSNIYVFGGGGGVTNAQLYESTFTRFLHAILNTIHTADTPDFDSILLRNLRIISQYFLTLKLCSRSCCFSSSKAFACSCSTINFVLTSWKETIKLETFPRNKLTSGLNIRRHIEEEAPFTCHLLARCQEVIPQ